MTPVLRALLGVLALARGAAAVGETVYPDAQIAGLNWVIVPEGALFEMGGTAPDQFPQHLVNLSSFNISQTEVTNSQFLVFMNELNDAGLLAREECHDGTEYIDCQVLTPGSHLYYESQPCMFTGGWGVGEENTNICWIQYDEEANEYYLNDTVVKEAGAEYDVGQWPVTFETWYCAQTFADWYGYKLPLEAQWEYAARAAEPSFAFPTVDGTATNLTANFDEHVGHPMPVGSYPPNAWNLSDMGGNAWEWCADWQGQDSAGVGPNVYYQTCLIEEPVLNPLGANKTEPSQTVGACEGGPTTPYTCNTRVLRGGSYNYQAQEMATTYDRGEFPYRANDHFSIRLVSDKIDRLVTAAPTPDLWADDDHPGPPPSDDDGVVVVDDDGGGNNDDDDGGGSHTAVIVVCVLGSLALGAAGFVYHRKRTIEARHHKASYVQMGTGNDTNDFYTAM